MLNCGDPRRLPLDPCTARDPAGYSGPTELQATAPTCIQESYGQLGTGQNPSNYTVGRDYGNGYGTMRPPGWNSPSNQECLRQYQAIQNQIKAGVDANRTAWQNEQNRLGSAIVDRAKQDKINRSKAEAEQAAAVKAAADETAKAERLKTNISNAVASGSCLTSLATDAVFNSNECAAVRAKVEENKKKGMSLKDAIQAVLNPPKSSLAQAGQNLGKAVDANKAAQAKFGRNGSKAKGGKKPDFKKQMARARGRGR